ncbi:hypothetical protein RF679_00175 [Undibacterium cyanobacteriorum]|uniref:Uncharacterized protein n=1 Tax=Undibacterium cyanobacteriorum TaxID=3073561 RepID=A0ABY9RL01_9BURK|nr:hypothetical protein [Undibacterium sp. 20NA77.5]WMW80711.1 hypothetical protein RF679_00175 [Undibacterium sp. 20NA77.5]
MKLIFKLAALLMLASTYSYSAAQVLDPLWQKTVQHLQKAQNYVAHDIDQKLEAEGNGEKKNVVMKIQQTAWKDKNPVYTVISADPKPKDGGTPKVVDFEDVMKVVFKLMLTEQTKVTRMDAQKFEGLNATLFQIKEGGVQSIDAKLWVHPETGEVYSYHIQMSIPLMVELDSKVRFAETAFGVRLGQYRETHFKIKIPFKKATGNLNETLSNWIPRP